MFKKIAFLLLAKCIFSHQLYGQARASAVFDTTVVETGEPFDLRITLRDANTLPDSIDLSAWASTLPDSNILARSGWYQEDGVWRSRLTWITFDADTLELPPVRIRMADGSDTRTNPLVLIVVATPSPDDPIDMADIKDIYAEPKWWSDYLWIVWILGGLLVFILLVLAVRWVILAKKANVSSAQIRLTPRQWLLQELDVLAQKRLCEQGDIAGHYQQLSRITRQYLRMKYQLRALETSTTELIPQLAQTDLSADDIQLFVQLLNSTDLVKFAKGNPPLSYHKDVMDELRRII